MAAGVGEFLSNSLSRIGRFASCDVPLQVYAVRSSATCSGREKRRQTPTKNARRHCQRSYFEYARFGNKTATLPNSRPVHRDEWWEFTIVSKGQVAIGAQAVVLRHKADG